ncbi:MAG: hypothetical protein CRN43_11485, partial [Candidatus Nephrothrix sp. EaCA]
MDNTNAAPRTTPWNIAEKNGYYYRVAIKNSAGCTAVSKAAKLEVRNPHFRRPLPHLARGCEEDSYTYFSNVYTDPNQADEEFPTAGITYEWYEAPNAQSAFSLIGVERNYTISPITLGHAEMVYKVVAKQGTGDQACTITSNLSTFYPGTATISQQPTDQSICTGENASFRVLSSSQNVDYIWQRFSPVASTVDNPDGRPTLPTEPHPTPHPPIPQADRPANQRISGATSPNSSTSILTSSAAVAEAALPAGSNVDISGTGFYRVLVKHKTLGNCYQFSDLVKFKTNTPPTANTRIKPNHTNACAEGSYKYTVLPSPESPVRYQYQWKKKRRIGTS